MARVWTLAFLLLLHDPVAASSLFVVLPPVPFHGWVYDEGRAHQAPILPDALETGAMPVAPGWDPDAFTGPEMRARTRPENIIITPSSDGPARRANRGQPRDRDDTGERPVIR